MILKHSDIFYPPVSATSNGTKNLHRLMSDIPPSQVKNISYLRMLYLPILILNFLSNDETIVWTFDLVQV